MTRILALASYKGGVGKSSLAVNVAGIAARDHAMTVLLVDADENRTASTWFGDDDAPFTVAEVDPATESLTKLRKATGYDLVVVDLPGHRGQALVDVVTGALADLVVIPARANGADMTSLGRLVPALTTPYRVVFNQATPGHDPDVDAYRVALTERGWDCADTVIRQSKGWGRASTEGRLVIDTPGFASAKTDARALTTELLETIR